MRTVALVLGLAILGGGGVTSSRQDITAATALAIERWSDAVLHHAPGRDDDAVQSIQRLTLTDRIELNTGMKGFLGALAKSAGSGSAAATRIADLGLELSRQPGRNAFLKRAAVLHGDAAIFGYKGTVVWSASAGGMPAATNSAANRSPLLFGGYLTLENDGNVVGVTPLDWNWVFASSLLDGLEPKHADDAFVGAWYHATTSFMFKNRLLGEAFMHLERAAALLPDDARIALDVACYAEHKGLPRSQQLLSEEDLVALRERERRNRGQQQTGLARTRPGTAAMGLRPVEDANAEAERLFRRVLALDPSLFEARLRLARLLTVRSQPAEALIVLRGAPGGIAPTDSVGAYFAYLFSARAERALGRFDEAAHFASQARSLFPQSQSALMAASQIAMLRADVAGAEEPMRLLAALNPDADQRSDPWWLYDIFTGRESDALLKEMWATATTRGTVSNRR